MKYPKKKFSKKGGKNQDTTTFLPKSLKEQVSQQGGDHYSIPRPEGKSRKRLRQDGKKLKKKRIQRNHKQKQHKARRAVPRPKAASGAEPKEAKKKQRKPEVQAVDVPPKSKFMELLEEQGLINGASGPGVADKESREIARLEKLLKTKKGITTIEDEADDILAGLTVLEDMGDNEDDPSDYGSDFPTDEDFGDEESFGDDAEPPRKRPRIDPYGRDVASKSEESDKEGADEDEARPTAVGKKQSAGAYVPPHLRRVGKEDAEAAKVRRTLRGLMNRVSELNLDMITSELLALYKSGSNRKMTEIFSSIVEGTLNSGARVAKQYIVGVAGLVAFLHAGAGSEVGALFLELTATAFEGVLSARQPEESKLYVVLLAHLYNFKVVTSSFMFDYIRRFIRALDGFHVRLLLTLLEACGFQLRSDDPGELKNVIVEIQEAAANALKLTEARNDTVDDDEEGYVAPQLVEFMLGQIYDLKNNKNKRVAQEAASIKSMLKSIRTLQRAAGGAPIRLHVSVEDLLSRKKVGRWWESGRLDREVPEEAPAAGEATLANDMQALARAQRMNTDVRRTVFGVIMSSEDYIDSFEKLLKLNLKGKQEREIVHVLVDCCIQEKAFNPFYVLLSQKLCQYDHNFKFTFQYALWDRFKALHTLTVRRQYNLARFVAHLIGKFALSLAVLKCVDFEAVPSENVGFFRLLFGALFTEFDEETMRSIFQRIAKSNDLLLLKEGMLFFFKENLLGHAVLTSSGADKKLLKRRVRIAKGIMDEGTSAMMFE